MPVTWSTNPTQPFAVLTITDPYTFDDWRRAAVALLDVPQYQMRRAILVDRRHATALTTAVVDSMVAFLDTHRDRVATRTAVVVSDDTSYGMGRMIEPKNETRHPEMSIRTFRDMDRAIAWLSGAGAGEKEPL